VQQASRLIAVVQLADIRLVEVHSKNPRLPDENDEIMLFHRHVSKTPAAHDAGSPIEIHVVLKARVAPSAEDPEPFFEVSARFELTYLVPENFEATDAELKAFGDSNAVYNAWPYFREVVQSMAARMSLPSIVLPVYRVPLVAASDAESASDAEPQVAAGGR
jgi:hypothetical protein